jgi:hypothetical protein
MQVHLLTIVDQADFGAQLHQSVWHKASDAEAFALRFRAEKVAAEPEWYQEWDRYGEGIAYTIVEYNVQETRSGRTVIWEDC